MGTARSGQLHVKLDGMKIEFSATLNDDPSLIEWNDGKWNANVDLAPPETSEELRARSVDPDGGKRVWVRLQSSDPDEVHPEIHELLGRRVHVTIETVD